MYPKPIPLARVVLPFLDQAIVLLVFHMSLVVPYRNPHHPDLAVRSKCYLCFSGRSTRFCEETCLPEDTNQFNNPSRALLRSQLLRGYSSPLSLLFPEESDNINSAYHLAYDWRY